MTHVILDIAPNTHRNCPGMLRELIAAIPREHSHRITLKTQLWHESNPQGDNLRCDESFLTEFIAQAAENGFGGTASVFDRASLDELLTYREIPFVKIACRPELHPLLGMTPRAVPVIVSYDIRSVRPCGSIAPNGNDHINMRCVPEYPAKFTDYRADWTFRDKELKAAHREGRRPVAVQLAYMHKCPAGASYSDHTVGLDLWRWVAVESAGNCQYYECHYVLERGGDNPDAGPFAKTPEDLREMLCE